MANHWIDLRNRDCILIGDPNTRIPETLAFMVNVQKA